MSYPIQPAFSAVEIYCEHQAAARNPYLFDLVDDTGGYGLREVSRRCSRKQAAISDSVSFDRCSMIVLIRSSSAVRLTRAHRVPRLSG